VVRLFMVFVTAFMLSAPRAQAATLEEALQACSRISDADREKQCKAFVNNNKSMCSSTADKSTCESLLKYMRPAGQYNRCSSYKDAGVKVWCEAMMRREDARCAGTKTSGERTDCTYFVQALVVMDAALVGGVVEGEGVVPPQPDEGGAQVASITGFKTRSMKQSQAGTLQHWVQWGSSSGDLAQLGTVRVREAVSWTAAPAEFGAAGEYTAPGVHNGLGSTFGSSGSGEDNHSIIPTGFVYRAAANETGNSAVWKMTQVYQYSTDGQNWTDIPGSRYEITRWFEKDGTTLVAYLSKRGLDDGKSFRATVSVPGYFQ
jgi:hypothetical protein